ncbi:MAG TPA: histidine kinase [Longimicrobiales bacterium]
MMIETARPAATPEATPSAAAGRTAFPVARLQLAGLLVLVPTAMGLLAVAYRHLDDVARGHPQPWLVPLVEEMTGHYAGVLFLAPLVLLAWRLGLSGRPWSARVGFHAVGVVLFSALHTTANWLSREAIFPLVGLGDYDYGILPVRYAMELPKDVSSYVLVFVIAALFERYRAARDRELRTTDLEARLARAQLDNLQAQLNPHFVFNALNTISSVMYEDAARADRMLSALSDLLRRALHASRRHEVTLADELESLDLYVELMRARFGDRLRVAVAADDALGDALVPTLLLQPLVENAIRHGAPPPPRPARIEVRVRREGDAVVFEVDDNGPGMAAPGDGSATAFAPSTGGGMGLHNTAERLRGLYGDDHAMTLDRSPLGGLRVAIRIPYHLAPVHAGAMEAPWIGSAS